MKRIVAILYETVAKKELLPSVELDTVWQMLGELEQRAPGEAEALHAAQECMISAVQRAEEDGFTSGFRCAAALWRECV